MVNASNRYVGGFEIWIIIIIIIFLIPWAHLSIPAHVREAPLQTQIFQAGI